MRLPSRARKALCTVGAFSVAAVLSVAPVSAHAATGSGTDSRPMPTQVFSEDSPFYQKLPDDSPTAPNSDRLAAAFKRQTEQYYGTPESPSLDVNYVEFAPSLYVARSSDPSYDIHMWNCQGKTEPDWDAEVSAQLRGINIPADAIPDQSADAGVSIYNEDTDTVVDLWQARKTPDGQWEACWGGKIDNASESLGVFDFPYGGSAAGVSHAGYEIRHQELVNREINHVIGVVLPEIAAAPATSWPANRSDGSYTGPALTMGQLLRLPADLDLDSLNLSPAAHTIAKAAQDYGIMVIDSAGSVTFVAENAVGLQENSYEQIFRGRWATQEMMGNPERGEQPFPLDQLEVLPLDYRVPLNNQGPSGPPPTDNPQLPTPDAPTQESTPEPPDTEASSPVLGFVIGGAAVVVVAGAVGLSIARARRRGA